MPADGGTVAAASAELKLFDLSSKKRLRKFPGHPVSFSYISPVHVSVCLLDWYSTCYGCH